MGFNHLRKLEVGADRLAWLDLPEVSPGCRLQGRPATEANAPYYEALVARSGARSRTIARGGKLRVKHLKENRDEDRDLFPIHVITGWENVRDENDEPVPFSVQACAEFFQALPSDVVDRVRNFFATPDVFRDPDEPALPAASELAENSASGSSGS